jgi:hypothetical protein
VNPSPSGFAWAILLILLLAGSADPQEHLSLEQILERTHRQEKSAQELIQDYVCQSTFMMREPQKDGSAKTVLVQDKTVYFKSPDRKLEKFNAITRKGKVLSADEVAEYQKKADEERAESGQDDEKGGTFEFGAESPWSPEQRPNYIFELMAPDTVRGIPTYVIQVRPREKSENLIDGQVWLHRDLFEVIKLDFRPAKYPKYIKEAHVILDFGEVQPGFWLPVELKVAASGGFLFIKKSFQMHETWRDYQINVALSDSLFVEKQ